MLLRHMSFDEFLQRFVGGESAGWLSAFFG